MEGFTTLAGVPAPCLASYLSLSLSLSLSRSRSLSRSLSLSLALSLTLSLALRLIRLHAQRTFLSSLRSSDFPEVRERRPATLG